MAIESLDLTGCKILVVDDVPANLDVLFQALDGEGYNIHVASDGETALEVAAHSLPDLVLLDVMMPGIEGYETCRRLKETPELADIPVLMLTGVSGVLEDMESRRDEPDEKPYDSLRQSLRRKIRDMRERGLVGTEVFMDKPVDPDDFIAKVKELLGS